MQAAVAGGGRELLVVEGRPGYDDDDGSDDGYSSGSESGEQAFEVPVNSGYQQALAKSAAALGAPRLRRALESWLICRPDPQMRGREWGDFIAVLTAALNKRWADDAGGCIPFCIHPKDLACVLLQLPGVREACDAAAAMSAADVISAAARAAKAKGMWQRMAAGVKSLVKSAPAAAKAASSAAASSFSASSSKASSSAAAAKAGPASELAGALAAVAQLLSSKGGRKMRGPQHEVGSAAAAAAAGASASAASAATPPRSAAAAAAAAAATGPVVIHINLSPLDGHSSIDESSSSPLELPS